MFFSVFSKFNTLLNSLVSHACMGGVLDWVERAVCLRRWRASVNGESVEALT